MLQESECVFISRVFFLNSTSVILNGPEVPAATRIPKAKAQTANAVKAQLNQTFQSHYWMLQVTFCCWGPIPIMKLDIFGDSMGFDQSLGPFSFQQHTTFKAATQKMDKYYLSLSSAFNKCVKFLDSRSGDGQR